MEAPAQSVFLTAKLKFHNPSQRRVALLLDAMRRAHLGYDKLLRTVKDDVEKLVSITEKAAYRKGIKDLTLRLQALARPLPLGNGPKQAIIADALAQAESYIELKRGNSETSYPTVSRLRVDPSDRNALLDSFKTVTDILTQDELRDALARLNRPGFPRPLNILKNRPSDGALLLKDENGRLLAYINLLPKEARRKRLVDLTGLMDTRTGEIIKTKTGGGDIFPISCGKWFEEKFLNRGTLQSSRLIYDGHDFYFACTFQFSVPIRSPSTFLGVDRGIELLAAWSVIDSNGSRKAHGTISGERLRSIQRREEKDQQSTQQRGKIYSKRTRGLIADEEIHKAANQIVTKAIEYNAQVVMEDLSTITMGPHQKRPKGARKGGFRRMLTRAQYAKLQHFLNYRLQMAGFPPIRRGGSSYLTVNAAYTSLTCSNCGHAAKENRQSQALFLCTACTYKENADVNAATIIAYKGIHFDSVVRGRTKGKKLKEDEKFAAWLAARKNGGGNAIAHS